MSIRSSNKDTNKEKPLNLSWSIFYMGSAIIISLLYYLNPGLSKLIENANKWLKWVNNF
ncbi:MAG: hypothetical protein PWP31_1793 [Clostridia bacterium]|nr:hypothetical protein [Clostridia bacterium]